MERDDLAGDELRLKRERLDRVLRWIERVGRDEVIRPARLGRLDRLDLLTLLDRVGRLALLGLLDLLGLLILLDDFMDRPPWRCLA